MTDSRHTIAEASRPWKELFETAKIREKAKASKLCGRRRVNPYKQSIRVNWFNPFLWEQINGAVLQANWQIASALRLLMSWNPGTFRFLHHQVVSRWMTPRVGTGLDMVRQWKESTLRRVEEGRAPIINNRAGILDRYPSVKNAIIQQLRAIRATGCRITLIGAKAIIIAFVNRDASALLTDTAWTVSDSWTRGFLRNTLGWSWRRGTTAAQKLPDDWHVDAVKVCLRFAYLMRLYRIPSCFVLNMDETGVLLQPGGDVTYHEIGASEVPITGAEDKRQFTLLCTIAMGGELLPFASLWKGSTDRSLPKAVDEFYNLCIETGHKFFPAGEKHWSTIETMMQWVLQIVLPYRERILEKNPQYLHVPMILFLDVYWSHRADSFLDWLDGLKAHTGFQFIVMFVPANTTSVCQPCDVSLQRPVKHELRRQHMATAVLETSAQLERGFLPGQVKLDISLPHLRNQTPRWLYNTHKIVSETNAGKWSMSFSFSF